MTRYRLEIADSAVADVLEQSDWYSTRGQAELPERWEISVAATFLFVLEHPLAAPVCNLRNSMLTDIRRTTIQSFPRHLVFYRIGEDAVIILRVLHGARDIESILTPATE